MPRMRWRVAETAWRCLHCFDEFGAGALRIGAICAWCSLSLDRHPAGRDWALLYYKELTRAVRARLGYPPDSDHA